MTEAKPDVAAFLHAVADPMRRKILAALKEKGGCSLGSDKPGLCAADIEGRVSLAQPTISHHMRVLEKAGLVEVKKLGHWRWYRRDDKFISRMTSELKRQL
jgi:ArsR family transcriptional regulator